MITQPIQTIQKLTSEAAGGNADTEYGFINVDRQRLEREARFARAVFMIDTVVWLARLIKRAVAAVRNDFKLRAAEVQLYRMTDRELADPLAPENILSTSGRGIFLVRQFMDDVTFQRTRAGGTEVRMLKHL